MRSGEVQPAAVAEASLPAVSSSLTPWQHPLANLHSIGLAVPLYYL